MKRTSLIVLFSLSLGAQETLSLDQAVAAALDNHPLLSQGLQRIEAARGQRRQAGLTYNTRFTLQSENVRVPGNSPFVFWRDSDDFAYLQQTFESAGKRAKRVEVADKGIRRAELDLEILRRQIAARVKQAYWAAAGAARIHELLIENQRTFQQIVEYHRIRVKEGAMAEADLLRVELEAERMTLQANNAKLDADKARILLYRDMGQASFPDVRLTEPLELKEDRAILADAAEALNRRPEVELARNDLDQSRANLRLQQAQARPNYDALFGYKRTMGYNTVLGGIQVDIPWLNRNQGNIETAGAEIRTAQANLAAVEAIVRAEVSAAKVDYDTRRRQLREFLGRFRQQAAQTSRIANDAYRLGGADLLRLLDAERLRIEVELFNYRAIAEYRQSIAALELALGVRP